MQLQFWSVPLTWINLFPFICILIPNTSLECECIQVSAKTFNEWQQQQKEVWALLLFHTNAAEILKSPIIITDFGLQWDVQYLAEPSLLISFSRAIWNSGFFFFIHYVQAYTVHKGCREPGPNFSGKQEAMTIKTFI